MVGFEKGKTEPMLLATGTAETKGLRLGYIINVDQVVESIKKAVLLSGKIPLMVGAGVKNMQDVIISLKMGAKSVGLASGFILSNDPKAVLEDIIAGFKV